MSHVRAQGSKGIVEGNDGLADFEASASAQLHHACLLCNIQVDAKVSQKGSIPTLAVSYDGWSGLTPSVKVEILRPDFKSLKTVALWRTLLAAMDSKIILS